MSTKQIILTSLRLQNVVLTKYHDNEDFFFVFGEKKFAITSFFADFFSSIVSQRLTQLILDLALFAYFPKSAIMGSSSSAKKI